MAFDIGAQKFCALDLELNHNQEGQTHDIIQVGICIGSINIPRDEWITKKWYLRSEYQITPFITQLTGITNDDIEKFAQPINKVADELSNTLVEHECYVNPVTWGCGDAEELLALFTKHDIQFNHFGRRTVDVKTIHTFLNFAKNKKAAGGLTSTLQSYKMKFIGEIHRADVDAFNTLRLFFKLVDRQGCLNMISEIVKENSL